MIFYLQEIFKSLIGNIIPPSSTMEALRLFIPISKRQEFKIKSFDQRKIFEVASVLLKEDINSLVAKVGKIIGVPPLIRLPNIHNLEDSYINQFLQCGAAPVILNENIIGIACVEPGLAKELRRNFGNPPLYVVSWSTIKDAIREATKQQDLQPGIYRDLLVDLLQEAKKLNSQGLRIQFQQQKVLYSFIGLKNIEEGELSETVSEPLKEILTTSKHGAFMLAGFTCNVVEEKDKNIFIVKFQQEGNQKVIQFPASQNLIYDSKDVLLVEDNKVFASVVTKHLGNFGISVKHIETADEALEYCKNNQSPALGIFDLHTPGEVTGLQLLAEVKKNNLWQKTPIIMLTSDDDIEIELKLINAGADHFISKGTDPRILVAHVRRILGLFQGSGLKVLSA